MMNYIEFLKNKILSTPKTGFEIKEGELHMSNLPHQRDVIKWAAEGGRRAIFAKFGLGKTQMQLELARHALCHENQDHFKALIICPLGVKQEFKKDADRLGLTIEYVRNNEEVDASNTNILLTNYERVRDGNIDVNKFIFVSLDEASVLRSYGSKTYQMFLEIFREIKYRYVCTATPSPNRYKEIIHYAGFLGIMDTGQALTRFFKRDSSKANNLTIHPHKEREFWLWVASWAVFLEKPSDLGYSDEGYDLPDLQVIWHRVEMNEDAVAVDRDGQTKLVKDQAIDLKTSAKAKRISINDRLKKTLEIIDRDEIGKHWLIWHHLEDERKSIEKHLGGCKAVFGSQPDELKEYLLIGFANGDYRILATKPDIAGQGCNFQHYCHAAIFMGIDYKFNDFIQAIHRIYRYQQKHQVEIHIIYTDREDNIRTGLEAKWARHNEMVATMSAIIKKYGLANSPTDELTRTIGCERVEVTGKNFQVANNDCVLEAQRMEDNSVGLIHTSIPFSNHYEYTPSYNDFGHTSGDDHFFEQMDYLTPELLRILQPGRIAAVHVKDRIMFGSVTGYGMPSVNPFHAKTLFHFIKHGFIYMGMITIETDVVRENNQTYRLGWTEQCKDGSKMGVGSPEYLLIFRKLPTDNSRAYADVQVTKTKEDYTRGRWQIDARAKWNSSGNRFLTPEEISSLGVDKISRLFSNRLESSIYDYREHIGAANEMDAEGKLPATFESLKVPARTEAVWHDINRMRTLNTNQSQSRQEAHICPLQFDIVERTIERWSNPGDLVFDPFGGLMTVPYCAIRMGRKGRASELNPEYFQDGTRYLKEDEMKQNVPTLFDTIEP